MYRTTITWRIQLPLSDDPRSRARFYEALADHSVSAVRLIPHGTGNAEMTGEVMIELPQNEGLGTILDALHILSPRVFVSCAGSRACPVHGPVPGISDKCGPAAAGPFLIPEGGRDPAL